MKTFKMFTETYADSYASIGPGINTYVPVADLNAEKKKAAKKKKASKSESTKSTKE